MTFTTSKQLQNTFRVVLFNYIHDKNTLIHCVRAIYNCKMRLR